ncbi:RNA 3'-terminal phosphate cyclase [Candidatus Thorarchaeota archaeon]|nr:MAG: RNA 3'-terminal phosphate cyclase [Candidatus Thorarchaeota archaeon]
MIEIDGSQGEGGGQILRTSISLAALTMQPIRVKKIRAGRPQPGLKRQHMAGIELTGRLVNATIEGLEVGSTEVVFVPQERRGGSFNFDVGTAGSISLVLQAVLPAAVLAPEPIEFHLRGGTDVKWSPPIDYFKNIFVPMIRYLGPSISIEQKRRGHYPRGGGEVVCSIRPVQRLSALNLVEFGDLSSIGGISHCVRLPSHIAKRQAEAAKDVIHAELNVSADFEVEYYDKNDDPHFGPGSGIVIWAEGTGGARLGSDRLGEKGERAESVGGKAAERLVREIRTGMAIDSHLCDMMVPYLAIASGESKIGITEVTSHLVTNLWTTNQILNTSFVLDTDIGKPGILVVRRR